MPRDASADLEAYTEAEAIVRVAVAGHDAALEALSDMRGVFLTLEATADRLARALREAEDLEDGVVTDRSGSSDADLDL